jgi:hypothetical protein
MIARLSTFIDRVSEFFAHRKGLLPMTGIALVLLNLILVLFTGGWLAQTNLLLHLGIIIGFFGFMLARAL